ncbi:hypothetical protein J1605_000353 [Eschrichtius robustus]|uniref:Uncharacterized protein n=1 Tax=Eschrichtius robustus TaxID=9764 RepID=A0AB34H685_ESCRO|nr:hypothetical protein J1605_000353 [Eschrichtius robustus]
MPLLRTQPILIECPCRALSPSLSRCAPFDAHIITYRHKNRRQVLFVLPKWVLYYTGFCLLLFPPNSLVVDSLQVIGFFISFLSASRRFGFTSVKGHGNRISVRNSRLAGPSLHPLEKFLVRPPCPLPRLLPLCSAPTSCRALEGARGLGSPGAALAAGRAPAAKGLAVGGSSRQPRPLPGATFKLAPALRRHLGGFARRAFWIQPGGRCSVSVRRFSPRPLRAQRAERQCLEWF